jgi:hypothetical protein
MGAVEKRRALRAVVVAMERNMMAVVFVWFGLVVVRWVEVVDDLEMDPMK